MYRLDKFKRRKEYLKCRMPFGRIVNFNGVAIVVDKDGGLQTTFKYRGPDLDSTVREQLAILTVQLNSIFMTYGTGWVIYFEARRSKFTSYAEDVHFPDAATAAIDAERKALFSAGIYFESDYYATLYWLPPIDAEGRLKDFMVEGKQKRIVNAEDHLKVFVNYTTKLVTFFRNLLSDVRLLDENEILTYLHGTVSAYEHPVRLPQNPLLLDSLLYDTPLSGELEPTLGSLHTRVIVPLTLPFSSQFGFFNELNRLDFSYRWVTRFYFLDKQDTISILKEKGSNWSRNLKGIFQTLKEIAMPTSEKKESKSAKIKINEVETAQTHVESDEINYGYYSTMFIVTDQDLKTVEKKAQILEQIFLNYGVKAQIENVNALDAWFGSIAGAVYKHVRRPIISTGNLVHLLPLADIWAGPQRNAHLNGPALIYTETEGSTPFRLNLHVGDVGHTMLVGRTGAGKSVHLNLIAAQFRKYKNAKVFIFDKGGSSRVLAAAVGGNFFDLGDEGSRLSFQPLAYIDLDSERTWALEWLLSYVRKENVAVTPEIREALEIALRSMATLAIEYRTMTTLCASVQHVTLKEALKSLTLDGPYGDIFDSNADQLVLTSWQVFEMGKVLESPALVPLLMYLFHWIERQLTGEFPAIIVVDEFLRFIDKPEFASKIVDWLLVLRKSNASVVFALQDLDSLVKNPIFSTVLTNCLTRIFLPNPQAIEARSKEVYELFGLNDRQLEIIATAVPKKQYYYVSEQGARLYDLVLGPAALAYCAVDTVDQMKCKEILDKYGQGAFVEKWNKYKKVDQGQGGSKHEEHQ